jgi:hypothetical protein
METFISDVSTTSTNIAIARKIASLVSPLDSSLSVVVASAVTRRSRHRGPAAFALSRAPSMRP